VIGDGHAVRIGAEVTQYVVRSAERAFGIDDPLVPVSLAQ
jgi:hypothetical protein